MTIVCKIEGFYNSNIEYLLLETFNKYTGEKIAVILAKELLTKFFSPELEVSKIDKYDFKVCELIKDLSNSYQNIVRKKSAA